ncbi:MAG: PepSY-associated TM helix domain-containing protein [Fimbriimonadaceae bacterium]
MYHRIRTWHRWIGLACSIALLLISATGFLLAIKARVDWIRPAERTGTLSDAPSTVVGVEAAMAAAFAQGIPELASPADVDRVDYRPKRNVYKVVSRRGYHEVQVDGANGEVLQVARRNDQFIEDLHDLSFFGEPLHRWVLPVVGAGLFALSLSGVVIYSVPVVRRMRFRRSGRSAAGR